jgi:hypothetical protein
LAVLGIDESTKRPRAAPDFSYMLVGVVYCTRVLAVKILLLAATRKERQLRSQERENFITIRRKYLVDGLYSLFSEMLSLLAYLKYIALNAVNTLMLMWSNNCDTLYLRG